jgi:hypothetical protein
MVQESGGWIWGTKHLIFPLVTWIRSTDVTPYFELRSLNTYRPAEMRKAHTNTDD